MYKNLTKLNYEKNPHRPLTCSCFTAIKTWIHYINSNTKLFNLKYKLLFMCTIKLKTYLSSNLSCFLINKRPKLVNNPRLLLDKFRVVQIGRYSLEPREKSKVGGKANKGPTESSGQVRPPVLVATPTVLLMLPPDCPFLNFPRCIGKCE